MYIYHYHFIIIIFLSQKNKHFSEKSMICKRIVDFNTAQISLFKLKNEKAWLFVPIFSYNRLLFMRKRFLFAIKYNIIPIMLHEGI